MLSQNVLDIIMKKLGVASLREIIERDFMEPSEENDIDHTMVELYASRNRGSVRMARGLFYTFQEQKQRQNRDAALRF